MAHSHTFIVTRSEFARLVGCTPDRVSKHIAEGMPVSKTGGGRGKPTEIDLEDALPWLLKRNGGDEDRRRYFRLQGDRIQQQMRHRAGELVEASEVEREWAALVAAARERLLALPAVALQRSLIAPEAEEAVIGLVDEALTELAARGADERA